MSKKYAKGGNNMKVILLDNIKGVGKKDEIINANDGYARNYLLPKNFAIEATKENLLKLQAKKKSAENKKNAELEANKEKANKLAQIRLIIKHHMPLVSPQKKTNHI